MEDNKNYKSYMFACNDGNIIVEAESKLKAIEKFSVEYTVKFEYYDWKIYEIAAKIDIEGNVIKLI